MTVTIILALSILLQFGAAFMAFRLIPITGRHIAWSLIAAALLFMGLRRCVPLFHMLSGDTTFRPDFNAELIALVISLLMVIGISRIAPIFTDRKRVELALRDSEEKYRTVADFTYAWEYWLAPDGKYIYVSPACERISGYQVEEFLQDSRLLEKITHPDDKRRLVAHIHDMLQGKSDVCTLEFRIITRNNETRWIGHECQGVYGRDAAYLGRRGSNRDITDHKRVEEALKEQAKFMKSIVQSSAIATFVINAEHKVLYWNGACEDLTGIKSEDLLGTSDHWKAFYDHPRPCVADVIIDNKFSEMINFYKVYERSVLIPDGIRAEGWYPNLGGKNRYIVFDAAPIRDDNGKLIAAIETLQDITERKRAEEALRESEERYRTIIENIEDGYFEVDIAGNFTFFNDSVCRMAGYTRAELMGMNNRQYTDKENRQVLYQAFNKVFRTGEPSKGVAHEIIGKDQTRLYIESSVSLIRNTSGQPIGFRGIMRNVTERKQAEEACRNAEERYRTLFEQSPNGILLIDTETGKTIESNETAHKQLGYTHEEFAALRVSDYEVLETPEETAKHIQKIIQGGIDDFETQHRTKSGEIRNVHVWAKAVQLSDHSCIYTILQDITEHRYAEKHLQQTLESLRKSFAATIQVMVSAVESRDPYTAGHQTRSADLARAIATEMGLPQDTIEGLRMAGSIHDIGKLSIPAEILSKPTKLTNLEFSLIKEHARTGYEMLKDVESPWPLAQVVYQHHERMDGSGYPRKLKGDDILMEARVLAVADVVEAMASNRPYRPGLGIDAALNEIEKNRGIFYDEAVVDACLRLFREKGFKLENT